MTRDIGPSAGARRAGTVYFRVASVYPTAPRSKRMTTGELRAVTAFFNAYVRRFAGDDGILHPMHQLKLRHSRHVVANAVAIMRAGAWDEPRLLLGAACALVHDVGRFSQYAEYRSFEDRHSIDHAERGHQVLLAADEFATLAPEDRATILSSVRVHNMRELPAMLSSAEMAFAHLVRDADKLDIFRVFEEAIREGHLDDHPEIAWSLDMRGRANPELVACVRDGRTMNYGAVRSLCDFTLIQVGWLRSQFHYDAALALAATRRALEFRETFIGGLDDSAAVRECLAVTREAMSRRLKTVAASQKL